MQNKNSKRTLKPIITITLLSLLFTLIHNVFAVDYIWNSTANGNWEDASNWTPSTGYPSTIEDTATINNPLNSEGDGSSFTVTVSTPLNIGALTIGGTAGHEGKVTVVFATGLETNKVSQNITIGNLATVTHFGPNTTLAHAVRLHAGGDITIASDASVNVENKGYSFYKKDGNNGNGYGPGAGRDNGRYAGETSEQYAVGKIHGSIRKPVDYGGSVWWSGANSAGAIQLIANGTITLAGNIYARGSSGSTCASAGGSIHLECSKLIGSGSINARGGIQGQYSGSGGRIAIYQRKASGLTDFTGTLTTAATNGEVPNNYGSTCGTIYIEDASDTPGEGTLIVDNANITKPTGATYYTPLNFTMTDSTNIFGQVIARNRGRIKIVSGLTLKVSKAISVGANSSILTQSGGAIELVGDEDAVITGASRIAVESLICTNAGKKISFGTAAADKLTIPLGKNLILKGSEEKPITLASVSDGTAWLISVNANPGNIDISHVSVKDSDASSGAGILALYSNNIGNNRYWGFSLPVSAGEAITWTGAEDTAWQNTANWSPKRTPLASDNIIIASNEDGNYPILGAGTFSFNKLNVESGASLTFNAPTVTITNSLTVAGTLAFSGTEKFYILGNADFTGGTLIPAESSISITGEKDQAVDLGNVSLNILNISKNGGNISFGSHGFTAELFKCQAIKPIKMTFAAGEEVKATKLNLLGSIDGVSSLTLSSSQPGVAWYLTVPEGNDNVGGVIVSDSDASKGGIIFAGRTSVNGSNNTNWDFTANVALWTGGASGDYTVPANWSTASTPDESAIVKISASANETVTITLPTGNQAVMRSLKIFADIGGTAKFIANSPIAVTESIEIDKNGILELNKYNDSGAAPNTASSVHVRSGGTLTHTKGTGATENAKIHLSVSGDIVVDEGGSINATGKGYPNGKGPGGGAGNMTGAGYASYGYTGQKPYGSILRPIHWGSATGRNYNGGGAIHLIVSGDIIVNGTVEADGQYSTDKNAYGSCGGSVWIECASLLGSGLVTARDSFSTGSRSSADTRGSGGRIAIYQRKATDFSAFPKERILTSNMIYSPPGTVYLESADTSSGTDLYIVGKDKNTTLETVFPMPNDGSDYSIYTNLNIHVGISTVLSIGKLTGGAPVEIRSISIENTGKVKMYTGCDLSVRKGISITSSGSTLSSSNSSLIFTDESDAELIGISRISGFSSIVCKTPGKALLFGSSQADTFVIPESTSLVLEGNAEKPVKLYPSDASSTWMVNLSASAPSLIKYVAASNSNASAGTTVLAINSIDLGGNTAWTFSKEIVPGEIITWTGETSSEWTDGSNWDRGRVPVETDKILIKSTGAFSPTLPTGTYLYNDIEIEKNSILTLDGATLTVTNLLTNCGTLIFKSDETLILKGNAFFTNGTVVAEASYIRIAGTSPQTLDFGDTSLGKVYIENLGGPVSFTGHGFTAKSFTCSLETTSLIFEPGCLYDFKTCHINAQKDGTGITLASRQGGSQYFIKVYEMNHSFSRTYVSDCDASLGAKAYGGKTSINEGNNTNWDFSTDVAVWEGGDRGEFNNEANWSSMSIPTLETLTILIAPENKTLNITVPADQTAKAHSIILSAEGNGKVNLIAKGPIVVASDVEVRSGCTLTLDAYNDEGAAPNIVSNDFRILKGGKLTHSGPASVENAKVHLSVIGNMTIAEGASITAEGKGYSGGRTHYGTIELLFSSSHAGWGSYTTAPPYGSIMRPVTWGSSTQFHNSGGAIHLDVSGNLTVDGTISANGIGSATYASAGGSVFLKCAALNGKGMITAQPGNNGNSPTSAYTSSGGRIAIHQSIARDFSEFPKSRILASRNSAAACGTVYLQSADKKHGADLYIETGKSSDYDTAFPMSEDGDASTCYKHVNLIIGNGGRVKVSRGTDNIPQTITVRSLSLASPSARLDLNANFITVIDPEWKRGKDWSPSATIENGTYNKVNGKITFLSRGTLILVR